MAVIHPAGRREPAGYLFELSLENTKLGALRAHGRQLLVDEREQPGTDGSATVAVENGGQRLEVGEGETERACSPDEVKAEGRTVTVLPIA
jgi:hypothetical protein